jgi:hypothetical protein
VFQQEYEKINVCVRGFATELLNLCRSSLEIRTMLAVHKTGQGKPIKVTADAGYPRIRLALDFKQKEVCSVFQWGN